MRELGRLDDAEAAYQDAKNRFSNNAVCFSGYAETLRELGRLDEAEAAYWDAKIRFSNDAFCFTGHAETLRELGRLEEAEVAYREAKIRFPKEPVCFNGYAETLREMSRLDDAVQAYRQTLGLFPRDRVAKNAYACLLLEQDENFAVEDILPLVQPRSYQDWRDFHVSAMAKLRQGLLPEAEELLQKGERETPFPRQREVFSTSLALLQLRRSRLDEINMVELNTAQIIQFPLRAVLNAHALAEQAQHSAAEQLLEQVRQSGRCQIIRLSDAISRRYGLKSQVEDTPQLDRLIADMEFSLVLRAA